MYSVLLGIQLKGMLGKVVACQDGQHGGIKPLREIALIRRSFGESECFPMHEH
jgi:hypothetical protein